MAENLAKRSPKILSAILHTVVAAPAVIVGAILGTATAKFVKNKEK